METRFVGIADHSGGPANLQQPCSQREQIPERCVARGIKRERDFQHDGDAVAINQQEAAAPWQHERKPGSTSLPVWGPPVTHEWEADLLPGSRQICIASLQKHGDETSGVWDWSCKHDVTRQTCPLIHLFYRRNEAHAAPLVVLKSSSNRDSNRPQKLVWLIWYNILRVGGLEKGLLGQPQLF